MALTRAAAEGLRSSGIPDFPVSSRRGSAMVHPPWDFVIVAAIAVVGDGRGRVAVGHAAQSQPRLAFLLIVLVPAGSTSRAAGAGLGELERPHLGDGADLCA